MNNIVGIVLSYIFIGGIIMIAKLFEKRSKELSRKFIHIMLSNWWFLAMYFFDNAVCASIVPLSFVVINYISYRTGFIQVMEREKDKKDGLGTVYYVLSLSILSIFTFGIIQKPEIGLCPILIMGYGDGFAALIGKKFKSYTYKIGKTTKTLAGSCTMFCISFLIIASFLWSNGLDLWLLKSILIALLMTGIEAISIKGTDNITVPICACLALTLIM